MQNARMTPEERYFSGYGSPRPCWHGPVEKKKGHDDPPGNPGIAENVDVATFRGGLPIRYSRLPVRRKLIRLMLILQRETESQSLQPSNHDGSLSGRMDYTQGVMDTAMLRGELRCRPATEMTRYYLSLAAELGVLVGSAGIKTGTLRREVRCRITAFLEKYAAADGNAGLLRRKRNESGV